MADGVITIELPAEVERRLRDAARDAGQTVETYAALLLAKGAMPGMAEEAAAFEDEQAALRRLITPQAEAFQHQAALDALDEYDRTGVSVPLEEALTRFSATLEAKLANRG